MRLIRGKIFLLGSFIYFFYLYILDSFFNVFIVGRYFEGNFFVFWFGGGEGIVDFCFINYRF